MVIRETPFRLSGPLRQLPAIGPLMLNIAERTLAFGRLDGLYCQLAGQHTPAEFATRALERLQVDFAVDPAGLDRLPATGPAIVVANHPYGGLEGLFLIALLGRLRSDVRIVANRWLARIPELREMILPVDVFGGAHAASGNIAGLRGALRHVGQGGMLVLFPAGVVSHLHLSAGRVCDPPWSAVAARLIRKCQCPVLPVHFGGSNGLAFQALGLLHPAARTVMLSRELLNKRNRKIPVTIGRLISAARVAAQTDDDALASFLRLSTYALDPTSTHPRAAAPHPAPVPIAPEIPRTLVTAEIDCIKETQTLAVSGDMRVVFGCATQLPWTLRQLGRLREATFRAVGEGTGHATDIDAYDEHYVHLIAWHDLRQEIAGAYRVGHVDDIVRRFGREGLYTHSLFAYGDAFLRELGPALELGRSFVCVEYQKTFSALLLLWRGIAAYIARHPRYRSVFGPVSVSGDYHPHSHALITEFLKRRCYDARLARQIRPRQAFKRPHTLAALNADLARIGSLEHLSGLIEEIEPDGKGVPILLKQYLKLGARVVGFNVDREFSSTVDGMIVVDLLRTEPRTLEKYMGRERARAYRAHHEGSYATSRSA